MSRSVVITLVLAAVALGSAAPAAAHVTVDPARTAKGRFATVAFKVPNERDNAAGEEPEFPAPVLGLTADAAGGDDEQPAAATSEGDARDDDDERDPVAWIALVLGALGLLAAIGALVRTGRRPPG